MGRGPNIIFGGIVDSSAGAIRVLLSGAPCGKVPGEAPATSVGCFAEACQGPEASTSCDEARLSEESATYWDGSESEARGTLQSAARGPRRRPAATRRLSIFSIYEANLR